MERSTGPWANLNDPWQKVLDEGLQKVLPKRKKGENREKFRTRCMGNPQANQEFPDSAARFAVCSRLAGIPDPKKKKKAKKKKKKT